MFTLEPVEFVKVGIHNLKLAFSFVLLLASLNFRYVGNLYKGETTALLTAPFFNKFMYLCVCKGIQLRSLILVSDGLISVMQL